MVKIIAENKVHLMQLIKGEMQAHGNHCNLNHIDVSNVTYMYSLFRRTAFDGDISKWDVSKVANMSFMFADSKFNQDISKWDVSHVINMYAMFYTSKFNQDISNWDVSAVTNMGGMFQNSTFNGNLSDWTPRRLRNRHAIFRNSSMETNNCLPYWATVSTEFLGQAINTHALHKQLNRSLISKLENGACKTNNIKI